MSTRAAPTLRLPTTIRACLLDLDGVLTQTAHVHAEAWKEMFDAFLRERATASGEPFVPFDEVHDYGAYVDGKERDDGVRSFLESRGIAMPEGERSDAPELDTVSGLGNRKNAIVLAMIHARGVEAYEGSVRFLRAAREAGLPCAVVSASANCREVLEASHLAHYFVARIDALVADEQHLRGKPAPDMFLAAAQLVGVEPPAAAVFEDALAGVASGRAGGFGLVVGVDRLGQAAELYAHGADVVVADLDELLA